MLQGYLAHKKPPHQQDHLSPCLSRSLFIYLLLSPSPSALSLSLSLSRLQQRRSRCRLGRTGTPARLRAPPQGVSARVSDTPTIVLNTTKLLQNTLKRVSITPTRVLDTPPGVCTRVFSTPTRVLDTHPSRKKNRTSPGVSSRCICARVGHTQKSVKHTQTRLSHTHMSVGNLSRCIYASVEHTHTSISHTSALWLRNTSTSPFASCRWICGLYRSFRLIAEVEFLRRVRFCDGKASTRRSEQIMPTPARPQVHASDVFDKRPRSSGS